MTVGYLDLTAPLMARRLLLRLAGADEGCAARDSKMSLDGCLAVAELAASAYLECKSQQPEVGEKLKNRLLDLNRRGQDEPWSPIRMAAAADTLDELGFTPPDLYTFVPAAQDNILRYFAKYPVTNAQYARFLKPENFENKSLWTGFPKYAEPEENYEKIGDWGKEGWDWLQKALKDEAFQEKQDIDVENGVVIPRYWTDPRFGLMRPNAPVVGISWYEANAYCKWLLANWDELEEGQQGLAKPAEIRLPTEAEWVLAAGGEADGRFAFGDLKDLPRYANTRESGINRTTPVWMYPNGASPHKVMDMSGNVFEWQANYYSSSHNTLVWRGGSWDYDRDGAPVSYRSDYDPHFRYGNVGFRVLALPSKVFAS